jgi:hypothetical protein
LQATPVPSRVVLIKKPVKSLRLNSGFRSVGNSVGSYLLQTAKSGFIISTSY